MNNTILPAGAELVSVDNLKNLHTRRSFILYDGDEITVKSTNQIACAPLIINGEARKNDAGDPILVYSIECEIRHKDKDELREIYVPIGTFTKRPAKDLQSYFAKSELLTELGQCADDFERFNCLKNAGKFKVNGFHKGLGTNWLAGTDENGQRPTIEQSFPILERC